MKHSNRRLRIQEYRERNRVLAEMGYASYEDYLASERWSLIRRQVFAFRGTSCVSGCGKKATQIHHMRYEREDLEGRVLTHLLPICRRCHREIEFRNRDNDKLAPSQAADKLRQMRERHAARRKSPKKSRKKPKKRGGVAYGSPEDVKLAEATLADYRSRLKLFRRRRR